MTGNISCMASCTAIEPQNLLVFDRKLYLYIKVL